MQNGRLLGFIGILSSLIQGGYVRRAERPAKLSKIGIFSCTLALALISSLPFIASRSTVVRPHLLSPTEVTPGMASTAVLYGAAALLAVTSATVVTSLTALASLQTDEDQGGAEVDSADRLPKGAVLGRFRSVGQLGRALGPIFSTSVSPLPSALYVPILHPDLVLILARRYTGR
jgi:hypothetical protein